MKTESVSFCRRITPFGPVTILWSVFQGEPWTFRIVLPKPVHAAGRTEDSLASDASSASCVEIDTLADSIESFLNGDDIFFPLDFIRLDLCSAFQQKILRAEHAIPRGRVSSYLLIAGRAGQANGARAAGTALATNPFPIVIPCHRAIRSDGTLGGYQGGLGMKRALLEMEGVPFRDANRVADTVFFYGETLPGD
jgi:methylated-DNA-[protein]-cysteine S-methyltransferase